MNAIPGQWTVLCCAHKDETHCMALSCFAHKYLQCKYLEYTRKAKVNKVSGSHSFKVCSIYAVLSSGRGHKFKRNNLAVKGKQLFRQYRRILCYVESSRVELKFSIKWIGNKTI